MAKKFFYISVGILALAIAYNLGANSATAANAGDPFPIGHMVAATLNYVLTTDGKVWDSRPSDQAWTEVPDMAVPIPTSQVAFLSGSLLISRSGDVWMNENPPFGPWIAASPPPGGDVSVEETTWGRVKAEYR